MISIDGLDDELMFTEILLPSLEQRYALDDLLKETLTTARKNRASFKAATTTLQGLREQKNVLSREFGNLKKQQLATDEISEEIAIVSKEIARLEDEIPDYERAYTDVLLRLPNLVATDTPAGKGEEDNLCVPVDSFYNFLTQDMTYPAPKKQLSPAKPTFDFTPRDHVDIGVKMGGMDFEQTATFTGARFVTLSGALAKLERVLGQWLLDHAVECGYREVAPAHLVKDTALYGTGQLPKFADDLFRAGDHYLIPTSEVSLTNMLRDQIVDFQTTPNLNMTALTPCYRAEAGSAGRDTRGMIRLHQFNKVELVSIVDPKFSQTVHRQMVLTAILALTNLGLPFRVMRLCGGELGFSAISTYDIEVWMPSQDRYREISSVSNCGAFQARRMNTRFRDDKKMTFVHTLNGSSVAVGRALVAIMENNQTPDGGIVIPMVLRERMKGSFIAPDGIIL